MIARIHQDDQNDYNMLAFGVLCTFRYHYYDDTAPMLTVIPHSISYGQLGKGMKDQWLLHGYNCGSGEIETFALDNIEPR